MWTDTKVHPTMGLQSTSATKRKHDMAANKGTADLYINCSPPPAKTTKMSNDIILTNSNGNDDNHSQNSLKKLSVVDVPSVEESWNQEPIDCISKLQAVAVPTDTWGSISTRSALTTTLLGSDETDDDDDDFEEDYDEEENIIPPTYCPVRYTTCSPQPQQPSHRIYPLHSVGYFAKQNFHQESFPQQNCSRILNQHFRMNNLNWNNNNNNNNINNNNNSQQGSNFYISSEAPYSQQTIRCAENGKSYLELGSSSFNSTINTRHTKKCGCDCRGKWCNNKSCYKDIRLKIRNLSMFKLSKFRQVSEQSLYRSVLICNTLKHIDKEIEMERKDTQQQQQQQQQQHHQQQQQRITTNPTNNNEYSPIGCKRVCNLSHDTNMNGDFQQTTSHFSSTNSNNNENNRREYGQSSYAQINNSKSTSNAFNSSELHESTNDSLHPYDHYPFRESQSGRATPFPTTTTTTLATTSTPITETDSGIGDDDSNRTINWSSVLSLSAQSSLDPLNNNDLFSLLPSTSTISPISCSSQALANNHITTSSSAILSSSTTIINSTPMSHLSSSTTSSVTDNTCSPWEYGFFDMDLGLGTEFTELVPGCKISSEEIFKSIAPTINSTRYVHDNELESPAHIMVGS